MKLKIFILSLTALFLINNSHAENNPLVLNGKHGINIYGSNYSNDAGPCITISDSSNITIQASTFKCWGVGVSIYNSSNIKIVGGNKFFDTGGGVYAQKSSEIVVSGNYAVNFSRRPGTARGQFVQLNEVFGSGSSIVNNLIINEPNKSAPEDIINVYKSHFTSLSPLKIQQNFIKGGGPSKSGCGILVGDFGSSYVDVSNNVLFNPGQCGIGVAGGEFIKIKNNIVYSAQFEYSNIGYYVWNVSQKSGTKCSNIVFENNSSDWKKGTGTNAGIKNNFWNAGNCENVTTSGLITNIDLSNTIIPEFEKVVSWGFNNSN